MALCYDDFGDPQGAAAVYLHGTPDSRLARHPDDGLAESSGVRLLAVDRPGYGGSPADEPLASGLVELLDRLGIDKCVMLAWSGGALAAIEALASPALQQRTRGLVVVAGLVPREAFDDPTVRRAAPHRTDLLELADVMPPGEFAETIAPMLAPHPCDHTLAMEHQAEGRSAADRDALARVPGATERMADALVEAVRDGLAGVKRDLRTQATRCDQARLLMPVALWYGSSDSVTPPAFADWYLKSDLFEKAEVRIVEGAGHYLPFTHWLEILDTL